MTAFRLSTRTLAPLLVALLGWTLAAPAPPPSTPTEGAGDAAGNTMTGGALPFPPEAQPPAIAPDIGIAELPFLVTEPPADAPPADDTPAPITGNADASNPFAPLLGPQAPEVAQEPAETAPATETVQEPLPPSTPEVVEVPVPPEPPAPSTEVSVPVPTPRTPLTSATTQAGTLPRRAGSEAATADAPTLLTQGTDRSAAAWAGALAEVATVRTPTPTVGAPVAQRLGVGSPALASAPGAPQANLSEAPATDPQLPRHTLATPAPMSLARSPDAERTQAENSVRRFLTERGVSFTAMSTGTGIFRTQESDRPILLEVGETLPGSDVVLVELTQNGAAFAQGSLSDVRHTLSLRP